MSGRRRLAITVFDDCPLFELGVPCEVFGRDRRDLAPDWYETTLCQAVPGPMPLPLGLTAEASTGLSAIAEADLVVIPACHDRERPPADELIDAVRRAHARGARIAALCTGAFVLAATGLLDRRRATTHWMHSAELRQRHPLVDVDDSAIYVDEGDVLTSAGTAAGIDLCLHIVRQDFGAAVAAEIGRRMVVAPHREGNQAQYVPPRRVESAASGGMEAVLDWARDNLDRPLTMPQLARRAAMSPRTFGRRFTELLGVTPLAWLNRQRVIAAREMLETTDLPVDLVAARTGFRTGDVLRQHFGRELGTTPTRYRRGFRGAAEQEPARW